MRELSILIVEDDPLTRKALRVMLEHEDYPVDEAIDGVMAVEMIADGYYDVVITDMNMPKLSGSELAVQILARRPDQPIILMTGYSDFMNSQKAEEMGIRAFVLKPLSRKMLAALVRRVIDGR